MKYKYILIKLYLYFILILIGMITTYTLCMRALRIWSWTQTMKYATLQKGNCESFDKANVFGKYLFGIKCE